MGIRNGFVATWAALALLAMPALAQSVPEKPAGEAKAEGKTAGATEPAPEPRRRLKFKGGPRQCVCASPVSESEIEAAMAMAQKPAAPEDSRNRRSEK